MHITIFCLAIATVPTAQSGQVARIWIEPNILVSHDSVFPHVETALAVNPKDAKNLLGACMVFGRVGGGQTCMTYASKDGGYTWLDTAFPERLNNLSADPQVVFGPNGTAYFLMLSVGSGRGAYHSYRSSDGGFGWQRVDGVPNLGDLPQMAVDHTKGKFAGRIYLIGHDRQIMTAYSADDGRTFSKPIKQPNPNMANPKQAQIISNRPPLVLGDGTLFLPCCVWDDSAKSLSTEVHFVTSKDGGVLFSEPTKVMEYPRASEKVREKEYPLIGTGLWPVFAVDPRPTAGQLYLAWVEPRPEGHRVLLRFSKDQGATWSEPRVVAPADKGSQYQVMLAVNREGTVGIAWFDMRYFPNFDGHELYFTASLNGGETFLPFRKVSSESSLPRGAGNVTPLPPFTRRTEKFIEAHFQTAFGRFGAGGDYAAMACEADGAFRPFWPDSRTGTFQIYTARIRVLKRGEEAEAGLTMPEKLDSQSINRKVTLLCDPPQYDAEKQEGVQFIRLRNVSQEPIYGPIKAKVARSERWELTENEIDFTRALRDVPYLAPGALTEAVRVRFKTANGNGWPILTLEVRGRTFTE